MLGTLAQSQKAAAPLHLLTNSSIWNTSAVPTSNLNLAIPPVCIIWLYLYLYV